MTVWNRVCSSLSKLSNLLADTEHHERLESIISLTPCFFRLMNFLADRFGRRLLGSMTRKLGWESKPSDEHLTKLLRNLLLCKMDLEVIAETGRRFDLHIKGQERTLADFRSTVYKAVLRTDSRYEDLLRIYRKATLTKEKDRIASALGTITNEEIIKDVCLSTSFQPVSNRSFVPSQI